ncbi:MAG: amidohydrolase family protein [Planctomycetes bacterium]|nr:amidohydrolase family protein [Planctomycetota bacterium]
MRALRFLPHVVASLLVGLASLPAQRPSSWRCAHVLAEDGASWRDDMVVETLLSNIILVRPARRDEVVDRDFGERWLIPGLIDLHTHLLLQPYDLQKWNDQVLLDSDGLRTLRAVRFAERTLWAGFVAIRDLGTEGAGYADVDLVKGMAEGRLRGPRLYPATRAIVQRGRYGPEPNDPSVKKGAQCVDGVDEIVAAVREQVEGGAAWIKVYADYGYGPGGSVAPTFSLDELQALCDEAKRLGRPVAAHAQTDEGMRRAVLAGVATIEHGAGGSAETFALMKEKGVVLCPCLAANEAIVAYAGHKGPIVERLNAAKIGFQRALAAGVTIACGSDAGVFTHGDNAHELELMVAYGMRPEQALRAATATAAKVLGADDLGAVKAGASGFVVLDADPLQDIAALRRVRAVVREWDELNPTGR